jgi:glycosyltransferase involved in cell wall biosynthesis
VVHNSVDQDFARARFGQDRNIHLIGGLGIDTAIFTPQPFPPEQPFRFLMIARLLYMKGIAVAIAAHEILREKGFASELVICGSRDVDNPSDIPQQVLDGWAKYDGVHFRGQLSDVRAEIARAHVLIHPALGGEGLPRVLMEASACERPLIASDIGGNNDIVIDGENGLLVKPGDAAALAEAMIWMMKHRAERERMGVNGRARVRAKFASHHVATSYAELYRELIDADRR